MEIILAAVLALLLLSACDRKHWPAPQKRAPQRPAIRAQRSLTRRPPRALVVRQQATLQPAPRTATARWWWE